MRKKLENIYIEERDGNIDIFIVDNLGQEIIFSSYADMPSNLREIFGLSAKKIKFVPSERVITARNRDAEISKKLPHMTHLTTPEVCKMFDIGAGKAAELWNGERHATNGKMTKKGMEIEEYVSNILEEKEIKHTLTNSRPHDIILDDGRTIEIRSRFKTHDNAFSKHFWFFNLQAKIKMDKPADFFILVIVNNGEKDCFVVPSNKVANNVCFVWPPGKHTSKNNWQQYHNRFDLLA